MPTTTQETTMPTDPTNNTQETSMSTDPTNNTQETPTMTDKNIAALERMNEITETINRLYGERAELGRSLPPVRYETLIADGCNFLDRTFERDVEEFMQKHMSAIDTTLLDRDDPDKWEWLAPRYESREADGGYRVWDHDTGSWADDDDGQPLVFDNPDYADEKMCDLQYNEEQSRCGFPFAWNTGWVFEGEHWLEELRSAGFLVYRYDGDAIIAGIDGGGYSFKGAHFAPLYASLAAKNRWMVRTNAGPRYLTLK